MIHFRHAHVSPFVAPLTQVTSCLGLFKDNYLQRHGLFLMGIIQWSGVKNSNHDFEIGFLFTLTISMHSQFLVSSQHESKREKGLCLRFRLVSWVNVAKLKGVADIDVPCSCCVIHFSDAHVSPLLSYYRWTLIPIFKNNMQGHRLCSSWESFKAQMLLIIIKPSRSSNWIPLILFRCTINFLAWS